MQSETDHTSQGVFRRLRPHLPNILAVGSGKLIALAGLAIGTRVLTEVTATETFGEAKLVLGVNTLLFGIFLMPLCRFAMREYHDAEQADQAAAFQRFARGMMQRWTGILFVIVITGFLAYRALQGTPALLVCALAGPLLLAESLYGMESSLLVTRNRLVLSSVLDALKVAGLPLAAAAGILLLGDRSSSFLTAQLILLAAVVVVARIASRRGESASRAWPVDPQRRAVWRRAAWKFVVPMLPLGVFLWITTIGDRYVLAYYWSASEVGKYSAVYGLIATPIAAVGAMATTLVYPIWFRRAAAGDPEGERRIQGSMIGFQLGVGVAAFLGIVLFRNLLTALVLGPAYREGAPGLMTWIAAGAACLLVSTALDMKAYASKRVQRMTFAYGMAAVTNIALNLALVPAHGPLGAARATAATYAVYLVAMVLMTFGSRGARKRS